MTVATYKCEHASGDLRGRRGEPCHVCWLLTPGGGTNHERGTVDYDGVDWRGREDEANAVEQGVVRTDRPLGDLDVSDVVRQHGLSDDDQWRVNLLLQRGSLRLAEWHRGLEFAEVPEAAFRRPPLTGYDPVSGEPFAEYLNPHIKRAAVATFFGIPIFTRDDLPPGTDAMVFTTSDAAELHALILAEPVRPVALTCAPTVLGALWDNLRSTVRYT